MLTTPVAATAPASAPAMPTLVAGRKERQAPAHSRGRAKGTQDETGPSEPILSDDEAETSEAEEVASQHAESSESGDDDTGSGSESMSAKAKEGSEAESGDGSSSDSNPDLDSGVDGDNTAESSPLKKRRRGLLEPKTTSADFL
ncbi:uncharacterized protein LOC114273212 [Camellia sinensis]|uniref:uncharacterized protein LOC114273212 n=1 Tax=Camellia sinensis TaxID=4442 RepID=UPI0010356B4D|nr:uncharacterized protein LOC114273212 [Camellia sinensis]